MYRYVTALMWAAAAGSAWGQTVGFDIPGNGTYTVGQEFSITLEANNFSNGLTGGGVDLQFNPGVLDLQSVVVNSAFDVNPNDSAGGLAPVNIVGNTATGIDFFAALNPSLYGTSIDIATFNFVAEASGSSNLALSLDTVFGPSFYDGSFNSLNPNTDFNLLTSTVSITSGVVGAVPEPPTLWLLAGAALAALSLRRWIVGAARPA